MSMDEASVAPEPDAGPSRRTWVERSAPGVYYGHNERGASLLIGARNVEGAFTPGELLKLALAGCAGLTADGVIARRVGTDAAVTIAVEAADHPTENRFTDFTETISLDLSGLGTDQRAELATMIERALGRSCTVGSTLLAGADVFVDIVQG